MKISTTNVRKKDGTKLVNGYKICLQKSEVESIGMNEETELVPIYEQGKITLIEVGRTWAEYEHDGQLWCKAYKKLGNNCYSFDTYVFKTGSEVGKEIAKKFKNEPLPGVFFETSKSGNLVLIWKGKKYPRNVNYQ